MPTGEVGFSRCSRHLAWLLSALQLILSKCKLEKKNVPNGFRARLNFGLVEDLNEFYRNVRGIIGKHSETIVITFQPVTLIIIIPLFRHANFWLLLTTTAGKPRNIQGIFPFFFIFRSWFWCFHLCCWASVVWYVVFWLETLKHTIQRWPSKSLIYLSGLTAKHIGPHTSLYDFIHAVALGH